jgi:two-component system sensor histidine kinase QseC
MPGANTCDAVAESRAILADLWSQVLAKRQVLSLEAPDVLHTHMPPGLVGVLVGNLVDNAHRYSPEEASIHVQWSALGRPQLVVQDSGPGLSALHMSRLGDRFFRGPNNGADGSGLGWSIVRRLAQRFGLQVQVDRSAQWGGLRVVLTWPDE